MNNIKPTIVVKRDNREKFFQRSHIESAIYSAICEVKEYDRNICLDVEVADLVEEYLELGYGNE